MKLIKSLFVKKKVNDTVVETFESIGQPKGQNWSGRLSRDTTLKSLISSMMFSDYSLNKEVENEFFRKMLPLQKLLSRAWTLIVVVGFVAFDMGYFFGILENEDDLKGHLAFLILPIILITFSVFYNILLFFVKSSVISEIVLFCDMFFVTNICLIYSLFQHRSQMRVYMVYIGATLGFQSLNLYLHSFFALYFVFTVVLIDLFTQIDTLIIVAEFFEFVLLGCFSLYCILYLQLILRKRFLKLYSFTKQTKRLALQTLHNSTLLSSLLPEKIVEEMNESDDLIHHTYDDVSVSFVRIVNFECFLDLMSAREVVVLLNELFVAFDQIITRNNLYRIKTIHDLYMFSSGFPQVNHSHFEAAILAAYEILQFVSHGKVQLLEMPAPLAISIGVARGQVVSGVIGIRSKFYDCWGETVNTSARLAFIDLYENVINVREDDFNSLKCIDVVTSTKRESGESVQVKREGDMKIFSIDSIDTVMLRKFVEDHDSASALSFDNTDISDDEILSGGDTSTTSSIRTVSSISTLYYYGNEENVMSKQLVDIIASVGIEEDDEEVELEQQKFSSENEIPSDVIDELMESRKTFKIINPLTMTLRNKTLTRSFLKHSFKKYVNFNRVTICLSVLFYFLSTVFDILRYANGDPSVRYPNSLFWIFIYRYAIGFPFVFFSGSFCLSKYYKSSPLFFSTVTICFFVCMTAALMLNAFFHAEGVLDQYGFHIFTFFCMSLIGVTLQGVHCFIEVLLQIFLGFGWTGMLVYRYGLSDSIRGSIPMYCIVIFAIIAVIFRQVQILEDYYYLVLDIKKKKFIKQEKEKTNDLLLSLFPQSILDNIIGGDEKKNAALSAFSLDCVGMFHCDMYNFTYFAKVTDVYDLIKVLNEIFHAFDNLLEHHRLTKVNVVGDDYIVASGIPAEYPGHLKELSLFALDVLDYLKEKPKVKFRIGCHVGRVTFGIIGRRTKLSFDIFGREVWRSKIYESLGEVDKIHVSERFRTHHSHKTSGRYCFQPRPEKVSVEGKPEQTYWLVKENSSQGASVSKVSSEYVAE